MEGTHRAKITRRAGDECLIEFSSLTTERQADPFGRERNYLVFQSSGFLTGEIPVDEICEMVVEPFYM